MIEVHQVAEFMNDDPSDADVWRADKVLVQGNESTGAAQPPIAAHLPHGKA